MPEVVKKKMSNKEQGSYPIKLSLEERRFLRQIGNKLGMPVSTIFLTAIRDWLHSQHVTFDVKLFRNRTAGRKPLGNENDE